MGETCVSLVGHQSSYQLLTEKRMDCDRNIPISISEKPGADFGGAGSRNLGKVVVSTEVEVASASSTEVKD